MAYHGDEVQAVFDILTSLSDIEINHILADLYSIYGWNSTLTADDDDTPGNLVVSQTLPDPKSFVILYYGEKTLTDQDLEDRLEKLAHDRLLVIVESAPTDQAVGFARHTPIPILGVGDIAEEIVASSMLEVVRANIPDTDLMLERYDGLFEQIPGQTGTNEEAVDAASEGEEPSEATDDATDVAVDTEAAEEGTPTRVDPTPDGEELPEKAVCQGSEQHPSLSDGVSGAQNQFFGISYLGHECVDTGDSTVLLLAIEVFAKEYDVKLRPKHLTAHSSEQFSYEAERSRYISLYNAVASELSAPWGTDKVTVSAGSKMYYLAGFAVTEPIELRKIRYSTSLKSLLTMSSGQIGDELEASRNDEVALEVPVGPESCESYNTLPSTVGDELSEILENMNSASEPVLTADDIGLETESFAIRVKSWDFYAH